MTDLIAQACQGDEQAIAAIFHRVRPRVVGLARQRMLQPLPDVGASDVAESVLGSFFTRLAGGQFQELKDEHSLWALLACLTCRKVATAYRHEFALRRGGGRTCSFDGTENSLPGKEDEQCAYEMADLLGKLLGLLAEDYRQTAQLLMDGLTLADIQKRTGLSEHKVKLQLRTIRKEWWCYGKNQGWDDGFWKAPDPRNTPADPETAGGGHDSA